MAAYSSASKGYAALGRRFVAGQLFRPAPSISPPALAASRRSMHASLYDKEVEDEVCPTVVPDDVMKQSESEHYWGPNPQTGVFGPPGGQQTQAGELGFHSSANGSSAESVLEQKTFFRPLEDLDKPEQA